MKLTATVAPENFGDDQIRFLIIESDEGDTKGYYLFLHRDLNSACEADFWFLDLAAAKQHAEDQYGILVDDWN